MKKKLIFAMSAIVALFATSCQENDFIANSGATSTVAFTVSTPEIASRAYSDGTTATVLQYAVYDAQGNILPALTVTDGNINISTTVQLQLTTGNTYSVLFWASSDETPYEVDLENKELTVDYTNVESNDENLDAFYKFHTFTVTGAQTETIELKRPFAQLNIGTSDYAASTSAGYTPTQSSVKVSNVYKTLKLADGTVEGDTAVTFGLADIKKDETFPVAGNEYLAMNYLLVASAKALVDIEFTYTDGSNAKTRTVGSVPVQRNYRTNIYGQLLTSDVNINVEIKPEYDDEYNNGAASGNITYVETLAELQAALNMTAAEKGPHHYIYFTEDIAGDANISQTADLCLIIDGQKHKFNGTFLVNGNARSTGAETLTFQNIAFESEAERTFISAPSKIDSKYNYSHNVTVKDCTFKGNWSNGVEVGGISLTGTYNPVVLNCTADNMHSLCQFQSCDNNVRIEDVTITNGKNGIALGNSANATLKNIEIEADEYGIRADGNASRGNLVIEKATITAKQPIVVRKATTAKYNVELGENVVLNSTGTYDVIFTKVSDDAPLEAPAAANYSYESVATFNVFPLTEKANTQANLNELLESGKEIILANDIAVAKADAVSNGYGVVGIYQLNGGVINGNGNDISVDAWGTWDSAINTTGGTIKNVNVTGGMRGIFINHNSTTNNSKVILENVTIDGTVYTISCDQGTNKGLEAYNSTFNGWTSYAATIGAVKFDGCSFGEGQGYAFCRPYAATEFVNCDFAAGYEIDARAAVTFENCRINGVALTDANLATLVVDGIANATIK